MRASIITALSAAAAVSADLGPAAAITNNPAGAAAVVKLPSTAGLIQGTITAKSGAGGAGVDFTVDFTDVPAEGGPFLYHIHAFPVPADGNCTETLGHLDPYERGETPPCDPTQPATCQVGDLSGKHGTIPQGADFHASYNDAYPALVQGLGSYFANRSIVVHYANKTRITCGNWALASSYNATTSSAAPSGTGYGAAPTQTGYVNGATKVAGSSAAIILAVAAAFL